MWVFHELPLCLTCCQKAADARATISSQNMPNRRNRWNLQFRKSIQTVFFNHPFFTQEFFPTKRMEKYNPELVPKALAVSNNSFSVAAPQVLPIQKSIFCKGPFVLGPRKHFWVVFGIYFFKSAIIPMLSPLPEIPDILDQLGTFRDDFGQTCKMIR